LAKGLFGDLEENPTEEHGSSTERHDDAIE